MIHILTGLLGTALANNGTFTTSYPAGKAQADFTGSDGHTLAINQIALTTAGSTISISFDASTLTVTNLSGKSFPAGLTWILEIKEYAETTGTLLARATGDPDGDRLQDVTVGNGLLLSGRTLSAVASGSGANPAVYGIGTAYTLTDTAAAIDFGTTDPAIVIPAAGTYLILGQVNLAYAGATVVAETATIKVRRTNNTAADASKVPVIDLPVSTTLTHTLGIFAIPPFIYTTTNADDALALFANVSAALGAGTIAATAIGTSLVAIRLF